MPKQVRHRYYLPRNLFLKMKRDTETIIAVLDAGCYKKANDNNSYQLLYICYISGAMLNIYEY